MFKHRPAFLTMLASLAFLISGVIVPVIGPPAIAFAAASVATCAPNSGTATIGGIVTGTGATPLNGVTVTAYTSYGKRAGSASTNASGVYQITGLIGGSYILQFKPFSGAYLAEWYNNKPTAQTAMPVVVAEGGAVTAINAQLETGAQFSGNLTGAGVGVLSSVQVGVYDAEATALRAPIPMPPGTTPPALDCPTAPIGSSSRKHRRTSARFTTISRR